jgi:NAD binding domain of 6-phosphogluconate dehydrogenase
MKPDALAIDSSTLSVNWVRELGTAMTTAGRRFVDMPIAGSRPQAEANVINFGSSRKRPSPTLFRSSNRSIKPEISLTVVMDIEQRAGW